MKLKDIKKTISSDELIREEKVVVTTAAGRDWIVRRFVWANIPPDLTVTHETAPGVRVTAAPQPDTKFFLHKYHLPGRGFPNGGISVREAGDNNFRFFQFDAVAIHAKKPTKIEIPDELKFFTGGHKEGSQAAEKAAIKELKRRQREEKRQAKEEKKLASKQKKEEKLFRKQKARRKKK